MDASRIAAVSQLGWQAVVKTYEAQGDNVYLNHEDGSKELFLAVFPTKDCPLTMAEQAIAIAEILNKD